MSKLLASDFYKLKKTKSFFVCLILLLALAVGGVLISHFTYQLAAQGVHPDASLYIKSTFSSDSLLFTSIVVSLFVACEFGFGTIKNTASRGFGRCGIYGSKLIVSCFISVVYFLLYAAVASCLAAILWGFGPVDSSYWPQLLGTLGLEILLILADTSVFVFVSSLIRQTGGAIAVNICLMSFAPMMVQMGQMLLNYLLKTEWDFSQFLISMNIIAVSSGLSQEVCLRALLVGILYFAITTAAGMWIFQKRDIK